MAKPFDPPMHHDESLADFNFQRNDSEQEKTYGTHHKKVYAPYLALIRKYSTSTYITVLYLYLFRTFLYFITYVAYCSFHVLAYIP